MVKKVLIVLAVVVVAFLSFVATRPAAYTVARSTTIEAPADVVFARVSDLHKFGDWSPWDKLDPNMKKTFTGPETGVGSSYAWVGNDEVGEGRMTIIESKPNEVVKQKVEFLKPVESTSTATLALVPEGDKTKLTWTMDGENNFMGKLFCVFVDMDKMIGKDFEDGLASLKTVAETDAKTKAAAPATPPTPEAAAAPDAGAAPAAVPAQPG